MKKLAKDVFGVLTERRSIRKFRENEPIAEDVLKRIIKAGSFAPSACNRQIIDYTLVTGKETRERIFTMLRWAIRCPNETPKPGEKPVAYIIPRIDKTAVTRLGWIIGNGSEEARDCTWYMNQEEAHIISLGCAIANITNQAWIEGIGSCIIGALQSDDIALEIGAKDTELIRVVIALGYPLEVPRVEMLSTTSSAKYYRDEKGKFVVQKREPKIEVL